MSFTAAEVERGLVYRMVHDTDVSSSYVEEDELEEFESGVYVPEWVWSEYHYGSKEEFVVPGIDGTIAVVDSEGGGEGSGEHMHIVFRVTHTDVHDLGLPRPQFFKVDGFYASWDGSSWDGSELYEVHPVERTITFYEK